jgi:hypothetical protein
MPKLTEVTPLEKYVLWLKYSDGIEGRVDLSDFAGKGVFSLWNDYQEFRQAHIGSSGEIAWNEDVDLDADALYLRITGKKPEDIFPRLREIIHYAGN